MGGKVWREGGSGEKGKGDIRSARSLLLDRVLSGEMVLLDGDTVAICERRWGEEELGDSAQRGQKGTDLRQKRRVRCQSTRTLARSTFLALVAYLRNRRRSRSPIKMYSSSLDTCKRRQRVGQASMYSSPLPTPPGVHSSEARPGSLPSPRDRSLEGFRLMRAYPRHHPRARHPPSPAPLPSAFPSWSACDRAP